MNTLLLPPVLGVVGMLAAALVYMLVMKYSDGEDKVKKIGDQIHAGALAFMKTEYKYLLIFIVVIVLLAWFALGPYTAISIIMGAICSSVAGFIGMYAATKANVRTATAAQKRWSCSSFVSLILWWLNNGVMCCIIGLNRFRCFILFLCSSWH